MLDLPEELASQADVAQDWSSAAPLFLAISMLPAGRGPALPGFTPDKRLLVIPNELSDNVSVFSLERLAVVRTIPLAPGSRPWQAKTIPTNGRLAYVSNSRFAGEAAQSRVERSTVSVLDIEAGCVVKEIPVGAGPNGVTVDRQGRFGYAVNMRSDTITVIDVATHEPVGEIAVGRAPAFAKLTLDGRMLVATNLRSASVSIIDTGSRKVMEEITVGVPELADAFPEWGPGDTTGIAITADNVAYITNYRSHTVVRLDLVSRRLVRQRCPIRFPFFVEVDRDTGVVVFSSGVERAITALDHRTGAWLGTFPNDGSVPLGPQMQTLNLWMTDPARHRITAILPRGISGISADWERNMVTKFM